MRHPQIAARVFHTPLLAAPAKAAAFIMGLGPRIVGTEIEVQGAEATPEATEAETGTEAEPQPAGDDEPAVTVIEAEGAPARPRRGWWASRGRS